MPLKGLVTVEPGLDYLGEDSELETSRPRDPAQRFWQGLRTAAAVTIAGAFVLFVGIVSFSNVMAGGRSIGGPPSRQLILALRPTLIDEFEALGPDWIDGTVRSSAGVLSEFGNGRPELIPGGGLRPGWLRLWKPTLTLRDYELNMTVRIEDGSAGWVFRASDAQTLYGEKLRIAKQRPGLNACMEHFIRVNGDESERVCMPVPMVINPDQDHRIRVLVNGDQFVTSIDGQVIDAWSDHRLQSGGVGVFAEPAEAATFRSIAVSERDSLVGRWLGYFSLVRFW